MILAIILLSIVFALLLPGLTQPHSASFQPLARRFLGPSARLAVDGLLRNPVRTALTVGGLALGPAVIIFMSGSMSVLFGNFFATQSSQVHEDATIGMDFSDALRSGELNINNFAQTLFNQPPLDPELVTALTDLAAQDGFELVRYGLQRLPASDLPPMNAIAAADIVPYTRIGNFDYFEGERQFTLQQLQTGPVILLTPGDASRAGVKLGDRVQLTTNQGLIEFIVAGIGGNNIYMCVIDYADAERYFGLKGPTSLGVVLPPGADEDRIFARIEEVLARQPKNSYARLVHGLDESVEAALGMWNTFESLLDGLLLLAVIVASLGVINTMMINITERGRELGLLRAVGATRRQIQQMVVREALILGVEAALLAIGFSLLIFIAFLFLSAPNGYRSMGAVFQWDSLPPALGKMALAGLISLIATPLVTALTAYIPARRAAELDVIEATRSENLSLKSAARREGAARGRKLAGGIFARGALRTRFVLGVGGLLLALALGLTAVVTEHARLRLEETSHEAMRSMVTWTAGMIEAVQPQDAQALEIGALAQEGLAFDDNALLNFQAAFDQMREMGLVGFRITDADRVVLLSLDPKDIGTLASPLNAPDKVESYSERVDGRWIFYASAPVHGVSDERAAAPVLGAVRITVDAQAMQAFLNELRLTLWGVGALGLLLGVLSAWWLVTPLTRGTRRLAAHAVETGRGQYTPYVYQRRWLDRFSLQAKFIVIMVVLVILMVLVLEMAALPIESAYLENLLQGELIAAARWMGDMASLEAGAAGEIVKGAALPVTFPHLTDYLDQSGLFKLEQLQLMSSQMQNNALAYMALVDSTGAVQISDQLALVGQTFSVSDDTRIEESVWLDEPVWVISTPVRAGKTGEQLGAFRLALRLDSLTKFLNESRGLFILSGLIAILAAILLVQVISGALAAPIQRLAFSTQQVAQGNFNVQFRAGDQDELAILAAAYNNMVAGLREREWLRDMFGRFVSQEVASAFRSGQVRLEGEHRVVSVLFCDIRDFTARSEQQTPEAVLALLNEYLPVVVDAAQKHGGTVNKFGGDSTLVIYGAPHQLQESAYQAVLTALLMRAGLKRLNAQLAQRGDAPIRIGIGINTGEVVAGAVGPHDRQEYTVIGCPPDRI